MKKLKNFIAPILCAVMIFAFAMPLTAEELPVTNGNNYAPENNGASNGNDLDARIAALEATIAALLAELDSAVFTDHTAIRRQREEAEQLERFMFRFQYYGLCLTIAHNDLLIRQQALTERQLALENVRLELGFTTQNDVDDLAAALNNLERQIELNRETIQTQRRHIDTRRGRDNYNFIREFRIPSPGSSSVRSADVLRDNLIRNNAGLTVLEGHIDQAFRSRAQWNEIRLLEEQRDLLTRQLELAALTAWNNYQSAKTQHVLAVSERPLLQSRLDLIDEMFELGELSEVNKMAMRFAIYAEQHAADAAAVALAMSIAELDFMMRGIVGG